MTDEQRSAEQLAERLRALTDIPVNAEGDGVHWKVTLSTDRRRAIIHCFWYSDVAALMLGMNPANARRNVRVRRRPRRGAEFLVLLYEGARRRASSRTDQLEDAAGVAVAWVADRPLAEIEQRWPFVNAILHRLERVQRAVEASCAVRCYIDADMTELAVQPQEAVDDHAVGSRACRVVPDDVGDGCYFSLSGMQVAFVDVAKDPGTAITRWMAGATIAELAGLGADIEPHAELLERGEYATWHWQHVLDRIADPDDVLAPQRPLIERLAKSAIATQFYSYSSLSRFCFSASAFYPWVNDGLPVVQLEGTSYVVDADGRRARCDIDRAVALIESVLARYPVRPFWGARRD